MADRGAQDKTEKPTPRRRTKAREQGQVAKSMELGSAAVLLAGLMVLAMGGSFIFQQITTLMKGVLGAAAQFQVSEVEVHRLANHLMGFFLKTVGPVMIAVVVAGVLVNVAQVGFMMAPKRLKPDLKRLNPLTGLKRFVSLRMLVDLFKNVAKIAVVAWVAYLTVSAEWPNLPRLGDMELMESMLYILGVCFKIFWRCVLAMIVLALLDWAYQKWEFEKNLKMSKQEVKDDFKQTEGDPQVRARIRSIQREQARRRMMTAVPLADVVITNPVHLAVALSYQPGGMDAPEVVAKGANKVAERIKELARQAGVPIIEDKPLAQALFKSVEVGQAIPLELYEAVASILAHVYRLKNRHREILAAQQTGA